MVKWISHRGESMDAPENTLAAFRLSQERQTDGMECDVYLTTDGKVMVCHLNNNSRKKCVTHSCIYMCCSLLRCI